MSDKDPILAMSDFALIGNWGQHVPEAAEITLTDGEAVVATAETAEAVETVSSIAPLEEAVMSPVPGRERGRGLHRLALVGAVAGLLAVSACTIGGKPPERKPAPTASAEAQGSLSTLPEFDTSREKRLLADGSWNMIGASAKGGKLAVRRSGEAVLTLEEGGRPPQHPEYQPNPPVNLYGTRLQMKNEGDVGIATRLNDIKGAATVSFLGSPNIRFDEHVDRQEGVDIKINGNTVTIEVYDGKSNQPSTKEQIKLDQASASADIAFAQVAGELHLKINGKELKIPTTALKHQVWFGFDADATVSALSAYPVNGNEVTAVDMSKAYAGLKPSPNGLASIAAAHGNRKFVGTAVDLAELMANPEYTEFVIANFNQIQTETLAKFQALQPEEGKFEFAELDALVKFANEHNLTVHGHALVFTEAYPKWLNDKLANPATTREQALKLMTDHIETVVTRYNGKNGHGTINFWDVVNEAFDPDDWAQLNKQSIWYKKIGSGYILEAFKAAQKANPGATLFLNDWAGETDADRREAMIKEAASLKSHGIKKIGLGFQAHFDEETLDDDDVMDGLYSGDLPKLFERLRKLGIVARISEASVAENGDPETQSDVYEMLAEACATAPNCVGMNLWGGTNSTLRYSYFTGSRGDPGNDAPTTQGADGKIRDRKAMAGLRRGLAA